MKTIFRIYTDELRRCVKDIGVMVFFVLVPLGYPLLYTYIYSHEVVRDIPVVACDMSNSPASREFLRHIDATPDVAVTARCGDMLAARGLMEHDKVKGIVFVPSDFDNDLVLDNQGHISIYCSMASLFYYKAMLVACTDVSLAMNKDIQIARMGAATQREGETAAAPMLCEAVGMANPAEGFADFVIPAILVLILQQTLLLGVGMRIGTDRERHILPHGKGLPHAIAECTGRTAAYLTIYTPVTAYILCVVPALFSLWQLSRPATLLAFMLPYLLACIFLAITLSVFVRSRESAMLLFVFTSVPMLFVSGISWPGSAIPPFIKGVSYLLPSTPGINGFVAINGCNATLADVRFEYRLLWLQAAIYSLTALLVLWHMQKSNRRTGY